MKLTKCECDNTHKQNNTVCQFCWDRIEIYDNKKTADRYTVIINHHVYTMSRDADSPQGVCLYYGPDYQLNRGNLGRKIKFNDAPEGVKRQIREVSR